MQTPSTVVESPFSTVDMDGDSDMYSTNMNTGNNSSQPSQSHRSSKKSGGGGSGSSSSIGGGGGSNKHATTPLLRIPRIEIKEIKEDSIKLALSDCDASLANALRRVMISEVPTLAFDFVDILENSSVLDDEFISHRLGLIPLVSTDVDHFKYQRDCECEKGCIYCSVKFELDVVNNGNDVLTVTQRDLKNVTEAPEDDQPHEQILQTKRCEKVEPVQSTHESSHDDDIVLVQLNSHQRLRFSCTATKGIAKEHAKYQPVSAVAFKPDPIVTINNDLMDNLTVEEKQKFVSSCPTKVYSFNPNNNSVNVVASQNCVFCDECVKFAEETLENPGLVKIRNSRDRFFMSVETTGSLKPTEVVAMAFKIIQQKVSDVKRHVEEIKNDT